MRKLLNTLYVTTSGAYLSRDGDNIVVKADRVERGRFPVHTLEGIVCFGYMGASPSVMSLCCDSGVPISYVSEYGKFLARVTGKVRGNVLLRRQQYRAADDPQFKVAVARNLVTAKILNSRTVLLRFIRDHGTGDSARIEHACQVLLTSSQALQDQVALDSIRGIEGDVAREYYGVFNHLIVDRSGGFSMTGRNRRPPLDPVNALLSYLYTLLSIECTNALESVGLDPQVGFLHTDRSGRPSLALDVMEELRPYLADRMALTLINTRQVSVHDFETRESGAVIMAPDARKTVVSAWQKRKQDEVTHPFLGERVKVGLLPHIQALLLARHIRGDLDGYPPFISR